MSNDADEDGNEIIRLDKIVKKEVYPDFFDAYPGLRDFSGKTRIVSAISAAFSNARSVDEFIKNVRSGDATGNIEYNLKGSRLDDS